MGLIAYSCRDLCRESFETSLAESTAIRGKTLTIRRWGDARAMTANAESVRGPHFLLSHEGELHGEDTPQNREIVRRIHACVSACEGISTEELESGVVQDMRRVIAQVIPVLQGQGRGQRASELHSMARPTGMPHSIYASRPMQDA
jgi:hypothetical protein